MNRGEPAATSPQSDLAAGPDAARTEESVASEPDTTDNSANHSAAEENLAATLWVAPNPYGQETAYLLLYPDSPSRPGHDNSQVSALADSFGLEPMAESREIAFVPTDTLCVALQGAVATLWAGDRKWLTFPATDEWTGRAIARRYIVLVMGSAPHIGEIGAEQIARYLSNAAAIRLGLVRIRLRIEESPL